MCVFLCTVLLCVSSQTQILARLSAVLAEHRHKTTALSKQLERSLQIFQIVYTSLSCAHEKETFLALMSVTFVYQFI